MNSCQTRPCWLHRDARKGGLEVQHPLQRRRPDRRQPDDRNRHASRCPREDEARVDRAARRRPYTQVVYRDRVDIRGWCWTRSQAAMGASVGCAAQDRRLPDTRGCCCQVEGRRRLLKARAPNRPGERA
jgi:hypothetical protein